MFEISATELLVIAVVAIVVIGPKDLPDMLRGLGRLVRKLRLMAGDFQRQMDQAGFEDVHKGLEEVRSLTSPSGVIARTITSSLEADEKKATTTQKASAPASTEADEPAKPAAEPVTAVIEEPPVEAAIEPPATVDTTIARVSEAKPEPVPVPAAPDPAETASEDAGKTRAVVSESGADATVPDAANAGSAPAGRDV